MDEYGVMWLEFGKDGRAVTKEKFFPSAKARDRFVDKLVEKRSFWKIESWSDSKDTPTSKEG